MRTLTIENTEQLNKSLTNGKTSSVTVDISRAKSRRIRFSRPLVNLALDGALLLVFIALGIVSVILQFVFPPGVAARGWMLWSLNHARWSSLQFAILCVLALGIAIHVMLHWTWVCGVIVRQILRKCDLPDDGIRTLCGVGLLIALLLTGAFVTGAAVLSIEMPVSAVPEDELPIKEN